jgi:hypothetical protein
MLKKYMIFGSVVLLLAALLTMTGCSQATDSDGTTLVIGENHLFGQADSAAVKRAVESAKKTNRSVVISDGTVLIGNANPNVLPLVSDFENLPVRVEGDVTVALNVIVNAAFANLTFAEGATITVQTGGAFIYQGSDAKIGTNDANPGYKVKYVTDPLRGTQGTDEHVAISEYTIGTDFTDIAPHITNLYVLDKITVNAGSTAQPGDGDVTTLDNPRVIALGKVVLETSNSQVFRDLSYNFQFTESAVLTSAAPSLTLTLTEPWAVLPTIEAAFPFTIQGLANTTRLGIAEIRGPDTLTITAANEIRQLDIDEVVAGGRVAVSTPILGNTANTTGTTIAQNAGTIILGIGNLDYTIDIGGVGPNTGDISIAVAAGGIDQDVTVHDNSGTINFDAPSITGTAIVDIEKNTGAVNFVQNLTVDSTGLLPIKARANNGTISFYGTFGSSVALGTAVSTAFEDNIAGSGKVVFGGPATFGAATNIDCDIVFNAGLSVSGAFPLGLGGNVTLANGQTIELTDAGAITTLKEGKKLLVGDVPVLVGGAGGARITPEANAWLSAGNLNPEEEEDLGYKTLTLANAGITGIQGDLRVAGTGLLRNAAAINVGTGSLTLEDGAILVFPTVGGSTIAFGTAAIGGFGVPEVEIDAIGGTVSFGPDSISGNGATLGTPAEAVVSGGPRITKNAGNPLLIAGVNLDMQEFGSLLISANQVVVLEGGANPGKITLGADADVTFASGLSGNRIDFGSGNYATLGGSGLLLGDESVVPSTIGEISGLPSGGRLTITAGASAATIEAGLQVVGP